MAKKAPTDHPAWADRMRDERAARGWSQLRAVRAMRAHAALLNPPKELPSDETLIRLWRRWESGGRPEPFYQRLIAAAFGTVTDAFFPPARQDHNAELVAATGMDTLEIISRIRASDVSPATLEALQITAERLCREYPYMPSSQLVIEARQWLHRVNGLFGGRLTLGQHRDLLVVAGWLALLLGCVEYDLGQENAAEATRKAAYSLGNEADHTDILGWSEEMSAWFALTKGNYRAAVAASDSMKTLTGHSGVGVQLAAQRAKAWARIGDRRQVEVALDQGRNILEHLEPPSNLDNHFVVDPSKFDFYAMDCYRIVNEPKLAELYANEVIRTSMAPDGTQRKPMRIAEANVTLGVLAVRDGDLEKAVEYGDLALDGERHSIPSIAMVGTELVNELSARFPTDQASRDYVERFRSLVNGKQ